MHFLNLEDTFLFIFNLLLYINLGDVAYSAAVEQLERPCLPSFPHSRLGGMTGRSPERVLGKALWGCTTLRQQHMVTGPLWDSALMPFSVYMFILCRSPFGFNVGLIVHK